MTNTHKIDPHPVELIYGFSRIKNYFSQIVAIYTELNYFKQNSRFRYPDYCFVLL